MTKYFIVLLLLVICSSSAPQRPVISYFWVGSDPLPQKYAKKLLSLDYPYQLIQNCDKVIDRMQQILGRRFLHKTENFNQLADICRYCHIYFNGGTYSDLDVELDYPCFQEVIANYNSTWPTMIAHNKDEVLDNYFFHQMKESKNLWWLITNFDQHVQLHLVNIFYKKSKMPTFNIGTIDKCLSHSYQRSFWKKTQALNKIKIPEELVLWVITWILMILISFIFYRKLKFSLTSNMEIITSQNSLETGVENGTL